MKWVDRQPIEGLLYQDPQVIVYDLDRATPPVWRSDSVWIRAWHWLVADLRQHVFVSHACAVQLGPRLEDGEGEP